MYRIKYITLLFWTITMFLMACGNAAKKDLSVQEENLNAKELLQGIWLDDETENPILRILGDTIYYPYTQSSPIYFKVMADTLYIHGNELTCYLIDRNTADSFWFHSLSDDIVKLHKSEEPNDSLAFSNNAASIIPTYKQRVERDSVVTYNGTRYRAYVYINPSQMRVVKTFYSEDGISMDNVYYDNVMHVCVYRGRKCLYAGDITRQSFEKVVAPELLQHSILSDMNFMKVDGKGFHYRATIGIPESSVCNIANLVVGFDGALSIGK